MGSFTPLASRGGPPPGSLVDPQAPFLVLGNVVFLNDEHPFRGLPIPLGQRLAIHELVGGGRSVQATGVQPDDITWSGILWDAQAATKMAQLKTMQGIGAPVNFGWLDQSFLVVIKTITATAMYQYRIEYEITCVVVTDQSGVYTLPNVQSIDSKVQNQIAQAQALAEKLFAIAHTPVGIPSGLSNSIMTLGTLLNVAGPLAQASRSSVGSIVTQVSTIQAMLAPYINSLNSGMSGFTGPIPTETQQLWVTATGILNVVSLIGQNAQLGQAPKTITIGGGISTAQLAAQVYGDATQANLIQSVNGLTSSNIPAGKIRLILPPATPAPLS